MPEKLPLFQQRVGVAFFLQMAACFCHFFSFLIAMLSTYFSFTGGKGASLDRYSINRSSRTNVTNIGRYYLDGVNLCNIYVYIR